MTGPEMVAAFEEMAKTKVAATLLYPIFNLVKSQIEMERPWAQLTTRDASNTTQSGQTYLTKFTLPTRFLMPLNLYVAGDRNPYQQIPFEDADKYQEAAHRFYIDQALGKFAVCGAPQAGQSIIFNHVASSPDISATVDWTFPSFGHILIPIQAAKMSFAVDKGERGRSWDDKWERYANDARRMLIQWDATLKKAANRAGKFPPDPDSYPNSVGGY